MKVKAGLLLVVCVTAAHSLTLQEALDMADRLNPQLMAAQAVVLGADAGITTARAFINPTLTFGGLGRQQVLAPTAAFPGMLHGMNFSQTVELPSIRATRIRAAEVRKESTQFGVAEVRLVVRGAVKQAFYNALRRRDEVELTRENQELLEDLRRRIKVQVDVGEAARLELIRSEAEVATARIAVQSAKLRYSAALSELYAAIGAPIGEPDLQAELDPPQLLPPLAELQSEMLRKHPSIASAEAQTRFAEARLDSEKAQRLPSPNVWMDYFQQPEAAQYRFGLSIALPILNRNQGPIAEAQAVQRQSAAQARQRRVELLAALERAYNLYMVASQQVQIFEDGTLRQSEAAVEAAQAAFKFGERSILEVLDSQRVLRAIRMEYLNARYDRQQALIALEQLRAIDKGDTTP